MSTFASILRNVRLARGLTREHVAQGAKVSTQIVSAWELGKKVPAPGTGPMVGLRMFLGGAVGDALRDAARAERVAVTFRCLGHDEHERRALELFRRAWEQRAITEDVASAFEAALKGVDFSESDET